MPRQSSWDDDDDDRDWSSGDDDHDPVDSDDDDASTYPCPACGRQIYEEADACPYCGEYLNFGGTLGFKYPWWVYAGAVLALASMLGWVLLMLLGLWAS